MRISSQKGIFYRISTFFLVALILSPIAFMYPGWTPDDTGHVLSEIKFQPFSYWHSAYHSNTGDRFFPLSFSGHQLVSYLSFSPEAFFAYNYLLAVLSIIMLLYICFRLFPRFWYFPFLIIFTPAFVGSHYLIAANEKETFFLWALFLFLFILPVLKNKLHPSKLIFLSLVPANLALYFKEPGFIMLLSFVFAWLMWGVTCGEKTTDSKFGISALPGRIKLLLFLLFLSSIAYAIQYLLFAQFGGSDGYLRAVAPQWTFLGRCIYSGKVFLQFIFNDPLLVVTLPLLSVSSHILFRRIKTTTRELKPAQPVTTKELIFYPLSLKTQ